MNFQPVQGEMAHKDPVNESIPPINHEGSPGAFPPIIKRVLWVLATIQAVMFLGEMCQIILKILTMVAHPLACPLGYGPTQNTGASLLPVLQMNPLGLIWRIMIYWTQQLTRKLGEWIMTSHCYMTLECYIQLSTTKK